MESRDRSMFFVLACFFFFLLNGFLLDKAWGKTHHHNFVLTQAQYSRLCSSKTILTINGQFPGPTIYATKGDTVIVNVYNKANQNVTLHWHGIKQPRNPWADGPSYITQCPIQPGTSFQYKIILSNEEGTLWWHAHSDWTRATVYGAIIIYPKPGTTYPFPKPYKEVPIILGQWWKHDVNQVLEEALRLGGAPNVSDAYTINGQPGDLYPCSKEETFKMVVEQGKTYLLRLINAGLNTEQFFSIAQHQLTVAGRDGAYTKPLNTSYLMITPGQTMDVLFRADQPLGQYYMAARAYSSGINVTFDNTTTTAIVQYHNSNTSTTRQPSFPVLPYYNDTNAAINNFTSRLRSLADTDHPIDVPSTIDTKMKITISMNTLPCANNSCQGPNGTRFSASMSNISFVTPTTDILTAYYRMVNGVFLGNFPNVPPREFNFTADNFPLNFLTPERATRVKVLDFNSSVEIVLQGTNLVAGDNHPIHLHGYSFYVVGIGFGNFDAKRDPLNYVLIDPPKVNTVSVPKNGWVTIRFRATNPGVWFMHCHLDRHLTWGMDTAFLVKDGPNREDKMLEPPSYMPPC